MVDLNFSFACTLTQLVHTLCIEATLVEVLLEHSSLKNSEVVSIYVVNFKVFVAPTRQRPTQGLYCLSSVCFYAPA